MKKEFLRCKKKLNNVKNKKTAIYEKPGTAAMQKSQALYQEGYLYGKY